MCLSRLFSPSTPVSNDKSKFPLLQPPPKKDVSIARGSHPLSLLLHCSKSGALHGQEPKPTDSGAPINYRELGHFLVTAGGRAGCESGHLFPSSRAEEGPPKAARKRVCVAGRPEVLAVASLPQCNRWCSSFCNPPPLFTPSFISARLVLGCYSSR